MNAITEVSIQVFAVVFIPSITALVFITRHFFLKAKDFSLFVQRMDQIEIEIKRSKERDTTIFDRLNTLDKSISNLAGKLDVLISKSR